MKLIFAFVISVSLMADCQYYLIQYQQYKAHAQYQVTIEMKKRYDELASKYLQQYNECLIKEHTKQVYKGFR